MNFGQAIERLNIGGRVRRAGWNGKGMWLQQFSRSEFVTVDAEPGERVDIKSQGYTSHIDDDRTVDHIGIIDSNNEFRPICDFLLMKTADNKVIPWLASQADVLAQDWEEAA
jgi:hypothetical protein